MVMLATSNFRVGASKRGMLVVPTIKTTVQLAPKMYSAIFFFMVKLWASAYFFIISVMAAPMSAIIRPCMALPLGWSPHVTCHGAIPMGRCGWFC